MDWEGWQDLTLGSCVLAGIVMMGTALAQSCWALRHTKNTSGWLGTNEE